MTMPTMPARGFDFDYDEAFSRNIGWVTEWEQQILRTKRVAIAGMGGVGGVHLLTLARLGIGAFNISDMDVFETVNFNRQIGASTATLGRPKVDVMAGMARDINPTAEIRRFPNGISDDNIDEFLDGVGHKVVTRIRDTQLYPDTAATGLSLFDLKGKRVGDYRADWEPLLSYIALVG